MGGGVAILFTSFGYHVVLPSVAEYIQYNRRRLYSAIIVGSFMTLLVYLVWQFLVIGTIPVVGAGGLEEAFEKALPVTFCLERFGHPSIDIIAALFSFFAIATSFLGVGLSLVDFLKDGLSKRNYGGLAPALFLALVPPALFWITYPRAFIIALNYAGWFVLLLLVVIPAWIALRLGKKEAFFRKRAPFYSAVLVLSGLLAFWMAM